MDGTVRSIARRLSREADFCRDYDTRTIARTTGDLFVIMDRLHAVVIETHEDDTGLATVIEGLSREFMEAFRAREANREHLRAASEVLWAIAWDIRANEQLDPEQAY